MFFNLLIKAIVFLINHRPLKSNIIFIDKQNGVGGDAIWPISFFSGPIADIMGHAASRSLGLIIIERISAANLLRYVH